MLVAAESALRLPPGGGTAPLAALASQVAVAALEAPIIPTARTAERGGVLVHAGPDYDVWLLWWPPGTSVTPHDHGSSAGAFSVVSGELVEVRWTRSVRRTRLVEAGETVRIGKGVVHDVVGGETGALSVHVYSPPLTEMGYYDETGTRLLGRRPVHGEPESSAEPDPVAVAAHPSAARS